MKFKVGDHVELIENYQQDEAGKRGFVSLVEEGHNRVGEQQLVTVQFTDGGATTAFGRRLKRLKGKERKPRVFQRIAQVSSEKGQLRDIEKVMLQLTEEVGELSTEIAIEVGSKVRPSGLDGVTGEAVDVALVALDIALLSNGGNVEEVKELLLKKIEKWESYN